MKKKIELWNRTKINTYKLFGLVINSVMGSVNLKKVAGEIFTVQHSNEKYM